MTSIEERNPTEEPSGQEKLKVFISYSRHDHIFVDRLQIALAEKGVAANVDRQDIAKGEEWWARIQNLISEADTIIFVLSPDSVRSSVCQKEVEFAAGLNKRFLPIVYRDVDGLVIPDQLARLNYIYFVAKPLVAASGDFDAAVDELVGTLETDIGWIREHTRIGTLAERWAEHNQAADLLLRGIDITRAEDWLTNRPQKAPEPTDRQVAYITTSRRAATKRQRLALVLSAVAVIVALGLAALAYWQRGIALENEEIAKSERDRALVGQSLFLTKSADEQLNIGDPQSAILLNLEALPDAASGVTRPLVAEAESGLYLTLSQSGSSQAIQVPYAKPRLSFSPDGRYVGVTAPNFSFFGDMAARFYDLDTSALVFTIPGKVAAAEFTADQKSIVALVGGQAVDSPVYVEVYSWPELEMRFKFKTGLRSPDSLAVSQDGRRVAAAGFGGVIELWDLQNGRKLAEAVAHDGKNISDLEFSPNGNQLASSGWNSVATLWDLPELTRVAQLEGPDKHVKKVQFNKHGDRLVTQSLSKASLWESATGRKIVDLGDERTKDRIEKVWFDHNGDHEVVITASQKGTLAWDANSGTLHSKISDRGVVSSFRNGASYTRDSVLKIGDLDGVATRSLLFVDSFAEVRDLHLAPNHKSLIVNTGKSRLMVHKLALPAPTSFTTSRAFLGGAGKTYFNSDGRFIATHVPLKGETKLWRSNSPEPLRSFDKKMTQVAFSPSGKRLALIGDQGEVMLLEASSGEKLWQTDGGVRAWRIAFREDGLRLYAVKVDGTIIVLDTQSGRMREKHDQFGSRGLTLNHPLVSAIALSRLGDLAVARPEGETFIWRETENKVIAKISGHHTWEELAKTSSGIKTLVYSPDGQLLVTAGLDHLARVWDGREYKILFTLKGHEQPISHLSFSPDGKMILTVSGDKSARVWNTKTGKLQALIRDVECRVKNAVFSPDSKRIATLCETANTLMLWDAKTGQSWGRMKLRENFPDTLAFHPAGTHIIVSGTARETLPYFNSTEDLVAKAKKSATRCLSADERRTYGLGGQPRRWCITGPGRENTSDPTKWQPLWPHQSSKWRDWLLARDRGERVTEPSPQ